MTKLEKVVTEVKLPNIDDYEINTYVLTMDEAEARYLKKIIAVETLQEGVLPPCLISLNNTLEGVKDEEQICQ